MLWCRVSSGLQNSHGNNDDQEAKLRAAVEDRGGIVVGVIPYVGNASDAEVKVLEALYNAANAASRADAVLLAESTSRLARSWQYHPKKLPNSIVGIKELRGLRFVCGDVTLVTLLHPDATGSEERSFQTKRGQRQKGKPGAGCSFIVRQYSLCCCVLWSLLSAIFQTYFLFFAQFKMYKCAVCSHQQNSYPGDDMYLFKTQNCP